MIKFDGGSEQENTPNGRKSDSCSCFSSCKSCPKSHKSVIDIRINYITQTGKANQIGGGSMQYRGRKNQIKKETEELKNGFKILSEMVELLKIRDN